MLCLPIFSICLGYIPIRDRSAKLSNGAAALKRRQTNKKHKVWRGVGRGVERGGMVGHREIRPKSTAPILKNISPVSMTVIRGILPKYNTPVRKKT